MSKKGFFLFGCWPGCMHDPLQSLASASTPKCRRSGCATVRQQARMPMHLHHCFLLLLLTPLCTLFVEQNSSNCCLVKGQSWLDTSNQLRQPLLAKLRLCRRLGWALPQIPLRGAETSFKSSVVLSVRVSAPTYEKDAAQGSAYEGAPTAPRIRKDKYTKYAPRPKNDES